MSRKLLILLLCTDGAFLAMHVAAHAVPRFDNPLFLLNRERGYPETFQYIKLFWIVLLLGQYFVAQRRPVYAVWASVFFYLLLDDATRIHERSGQWFEHEAGLPSVLGLAPHHLGELLASCAAGLVFLALLALTYALGNRRDREVTRSFAILLAALAFFGVLVDALHALGAGNISGAVFVFIEDGGEMLVVSVAVWTALILDLAPGPVAAVRIARNPGFTGLQEDPDPAALKASESRGQRVRASNPPPE